MMTTTAEQEFRTAGTARHSPPLLWVQASLSLSMLMPSLDTSIANAGLPALAQAFGASFQAVQWIVLSYLLAITTMIVGVGRLGDMLGRRRVLLAGISVFTVASVLCGAAPTLSFLIAARAAQGLGAAVMLALTLASVGETVPKEQTGRTMGLLGTMSAIGTTLGPSLGGLFIAGPGWRWIFLINLPLGLANLFLAHRFLPASHPPTASPVPAHCEPKAAPAFDIPGTLLLTGTLAAYALSMTLGHGRFGSINLTLLAAAVAGAALFVRVEAKAVSPLIRLELFRNPLLSAGLAMSAIVSTVLMSTLVVGPFYLARALGLDAASVGFVLSVGPLVAALAGVPAGRIVDRWGAPRMTLAGLIGIGAGSLTLSLLPATLGIAGYLAPIVCITASYALFQAANNTAVVTGVQPAQRGLVSGLLSLSRNLGLITGASAMGAIFALASSTTAITAASPEAIAAGMKITFGVAAMLMVAAATLALGANRRSSVNPAVA
ncbi:MFS transporter [Paludibaculum fermentans]|uniref:MFS transporter n=1 Tax=Paludibaculum fermentans TaxID=1473598 RepID=UPI003EC00011